METRRQVTELNRGRDRSIDIAKGIGIILVVWGHLPCFLWREIYLFHMPLFFFLSSLFLNPQNGIKGFFVKKMKGLIYPFVFFNLLFFFYGYIFTEYGNLRDYISSMGDIASPDGPTWFLLSLFEISIFCFLLEKYVKPLVIRVGVIIVVTLLGYWLYMNKIELFAFIPQACVGTIFFYIGYWGMKHKWFNGRWPFVAVLLCVAGYLIGIILNIETDIHGLTINSSYFFFFIPAICGSLLLLFISKCLANKPYLGWLSFLGQNSLLILCIHIPLIPNLKLLISPILKYLYFTFGGGDNGGDGYDRADRWINHAFYPRSFISLPRTTPETSFSLGVQ